MISSRCRSQVKIGSIRSLPPDVQSLIRCNERNQLNYVLLEKPDVSSNLDKNGGELRRNIDPIYTFSFGRLSFDRNDGSFIGDPWENIGAHNQPLGLGAISKQFCGANDCGTKVFVCGG